MKPGRVPEWTLNGPELDEKYWTSEKFQANYENCRLDFLGVFWRGEKHAKKLTKTAGRAKRRTARRNAEGAGEGLGGVKNRKIKAKD